MIFWLFVPIFLGLLFLFKHGKRDVNSGNIDTVLRFELRHEHAVSPGGHVVLRDARPLYSAAEAPIVRTRRIKSYRPSSHEAFSSARWRSIRYAESKLVDWDEEDMLAPDVESRETLLDLAKMTSNAYYEKSDGANWYNITGPWNTSYPVGWEPDEDGFRGHVYLTPDNSTVVLSIKGTDIPYIGSGPTMEKDKLNDNLLFSCCCAHVDWTWTPVCDCYRRGWQCDQICLERALIEESLFYSVGINLYNNMTYLYPNANIWLTGHSLGGGLASLMGITFGVPTITFETPGDRLAARRLHLPSPPEVQHVTHVYHTADPIPMGVCTGVLSSCALGGYALETHCHLGRSIIYDTVSNASWSVNVRTHGIMYIVDNLLSHPWPPSVAEGREVPEATPEEDCVECFSWEFGNFPKVANHTTTPSGKSYVP